MTPLEMMADLAAQNRRSRAGEGEPGLATTLGGLSSLSRGESSGGRGVAGGSSRRAPVVRDTHVRVGGSGASSATASRSGGYVVTSDAITPARSTR